MSSTINANNTTGLVSTADTSGILQLQTNGTTAVTVDDSQRVGIGTTSPSRLLHLNSSLPILQFTNPTTGTTANDGTLLYQSGANFTIEQQDSGYINVVTGGTERARIDSSGNLLVGVTSQIGSGKISVPYSSSAYGIAMKSTTADSANYAIEFKNSSNSGVGAIYASTTTTTYATSSDYRLKENIAPMTGALSIVAQLKPCTYKWKSNGSDGQGFIAHELQSVVPDAVVGEKDAVDEEGNPKYQGIDTSFLVASLTAAIQEQQTLIESLTQRITALEGAQP